MKKKSKEMMAESKPSTSKRLYSVLSRQGLVTEGQFSDSDSSSCEEDAPEEEESGSGTGTL